MGFITNVLKGVVKGMVVGFIIAVGFSMLLSFGFWESYMIAGVSIAATTEGGRE